MTAYAAFLRGVNLGSERKASSAALRSCFEGLGFDDVATFRTSGNVVFASRRGAGSIVDEIERGLAAAFGFDVDVFLRSSAEVIAIAAQRPFPPAAVKRSKGKLQVALLRSAPKAAVKRQVLALADDEDRLAIDGRQLYWLPSGGTQKSELDMRAIDRAVGPMTMRTMGTIQGLAEKFFT